MNLPANRCYDCTPSPIVPIVTLCPKHASVDRLIEALGALTCAAEPLIALYLDEWEPGLGDLIEPAKAARALLDELTQAQGTQIPETGGTE